MQRTLDIQCSRLLKTTMAVAKAKGKLRRKQPKLSKAHEAHLVTVHLAGRRTTAEIAELFGVARSAVYRAIKRAGEGAA